MEDNDNRLVRDNVHLLSQTTIKDQRQAETSIKDFSHSVTSIKYMILQ
jgi:hypothetical protein